MNIKRRPRDPEVLRSDYKKVLRVADDFKSSKIGLLAACRAMRAISFFIDTQDEPDFKLLTEIAEKTWNLPIDSDQEFAPYKGTTEELKTELSELEHKYRQSVTTTIESIARKYRSIIEQHASAKDSECNSSS